MFLLVKLTYNIDEVTFIHNRNTHTLDKTYFVTFSKAVYKGCVLTRVCRYDAYRNTHLMIRCVSRYIRTIFHIFV